MAQICPGHTGHAVPVFAFRFAQPVGERGAFQHPRVDARRVVDGGLQVVPAIQCEELQHALQVGGQCQADKRAQRLRALANSRA